MAKSLMGTLPIYCQHLAEQTGVEVVVGGKVANTNGKRVNVPFTEDDLQLSFGYVAHEASHVRNTDMTVFQRTAPNPFRKNMLNILEDIRIERLSMDQYPGTEEDIRYLNRKVLLDPFKPEVVAQAQPIHVIHNALLYGAYWKLQEPQLEVPAKAYLEAFEALVGQDIADRIMAKALQTLKCESTEEVLQLVDAIIALLPSQEDQSQQPDGEPEQGEEEGEQGEQSGSGENDQGDESDTSGTGENQSSDSNESDQDGNQGQSGGTGANSSEDASGDQDGQGAEDQGEGDGKPEPKQKSSAGNQGESQGDQSDDAEGQPSSQGGGQPGNQQGGAPQGLREQVLSATEDDLKGLISEVGDAAGELLGRKAQQEHHAVTPFPLAGRSVRRSGDAQLRRVQLGMEHSAGLRQILNGLLQAQVDCRVQLKRQGKRIDTSRIAMMKSGETRVFRNKARAERQSAAIQFLFDKSGSMDTAMEHAEAALYAVLRSLEGLPLVTTGAMSFPGSNSTPGGCCDLIKRPSERLGAAVQAGGFGALAAGGTPLAEALWPAAIEVLRAKGERKVLFVITDGEPTSGTEVYCRELIERCEVSGIEVVGLGFGQATAFTLGRIFKNYVAVGSVSNLKAALFGVVRKALTA